MTAVPNNPDGPRTIAALSDFEYPRMIAIPSVRRSRAVGRPAPSFRPEASGHVSAQASGFAFGPGFPKRPT